MKWQRLIEYRIRHNLLHRASAYLDAWQKSDGPMERYTNAYRPVPSGNGIAILRAY